ncbi:hypothetical protein [Azoarcus olearius]|uniref:hypothetical protein n=1 Tax=Azoarcus sp. (strain BH72) TaxID=418699 RepID=UPI0014719EFE|nr:hypothetical protein [Azoarcus olearius]
MSYKIISGKQDRTKKYTIAEGIVTLPDGNRTYTEAFLQGELHYQPGPYAMELDIRVNRERRIVAEVRSILPVKVAEKSAPQAA